MSGFLTGSQHIGVEFFAQQACPAVFLVQSMFFFVVFVFSFCMFLTIWLYCKELVFILRIVTHFSGQFKPHSTILSKRSIGSLLQQSIVESSSASFKALKAFFLQLQRQDFNVLCHQPALMDLQG